MLKDTYASLDLDTNLSPETIQAYFQQLDTNGDRKLSRDEVAQMVKNMLMWFYFHFIKTIR